MPRAPPGPGRDAADQRYLGLVDKIVYRFCVGELDERVLIP